MQARFGDLRLSFQEVTMKFLQKCFFSALCVLAAGFAAAQTKSQNPGTPPESVLRPAGNPSEKDSPAEKRKAVTVQVGRDTGPRYQVTMAGNAAARTMLGYLSSADMLFPAYVYDENAGYVAQRIRGSYTNGDETTVTDIRAGELYLVSGGQLRLYFRDAAGVNLRATPVGRLENAANIGQDISKSHNDNKGDYWGVEVYFHLRKN